MCAEVTEMKFKNLRAIREDRDIKQKDIAKILNVLKTPIPNMKLA